MCKWVKSGANRIDPCLRERVAKLRASGVETLGCCCGHGRHPETIIVRQGGVIKEFNSGIVIPRVKRFYMRDSEGFFYLPEMV